MRRSVSNPPNPYEARQLEWDGPPPEVELEVREQESKSILSRNDSPDLPFRYSLNPYQGCYHGCAYCYARPSHQYLGYGAGTDFERRLVVKVNAPQLLQAAFERPRWQGDSVLFSGNTDCYQPLEARYGLTRACLEVCLAYRNPVALITKGGVVLRDVALLGELARQAGAHVWLTIPFREPAQARAIEPFAAPIEKRFEALRQLSELGVSTGISISPVIPGLNDSDVAELLQRAHAAGARAAFMTPLRLPREVKDVFRERLEQAFPDRVKKVYAGVRELRGGELDDPRFGRRFEGRGARWQLVQRVFETTCQRLGMNAGERGTGPEPSGRFRRPRAQLSLFE